MKAIRIIFTILLAIVIFPIMIAYPYAHGAIKTVEDKDVVTNAVVESGVASDIKKELDGVIEDYLKSLDGDIEKTVLKSVKAKSKKKLSDKKIKASKEYKKGVSKLKEEISTTINSFNTEENINLVISNIINEIYTNTEINVKEVVESNINEIVEKNNISMSKEVDLMVDDFADIITKAIVDTLDSEDTSLMLSEDKTIIYNPTPEMLGYSHSACVAILFIIIVLFLLLVLINCKHLSTAIRAFSISSLIAGIILVIASCGMVSAIPVLEHNSDQAVRAMAPIIKSLNGQTTVITAVYLAIAVFGLITSSIMSKLKKNK